MRGPEPWETMSRNDRVRRLEYYQIWSRSHFDHSSAVTVSLSAPRLCNDTNIIPDLPFLIQMLGHCEAPASSHPQIRGMTLYTLHDRQQVTLHFIFIFKSSIQYYLSKTLVLWCRHCIMIMQDFQCFVHQGFVIKKLIWKQLMFYSDVSKPRALIPDKCFVGLSVKCPDQPLCWAVLYWRYSPAAMIPHSYCSPFLISSNESDSPHLPLTDQDNLMVWVRASRGQRTYSIAQRGCSKTDNAPNTTDNHWTLDKSNNHNLWIKLVFTSAPECLL